MSQYLTVSIPILWSSTSVFERIYQFTSQFYLSIWAYLSLYFAVLPQYVSLSIPSLRSCTSLSELSYPFALQFFLSTEFIHLFTLKFYLSILAYLPLHFAVLPQYLSLFIPSLCSPTPVSEFSASWLCSSTLVSELICPFPLQFCLSLWGYLSPHFAALLQYLSLSISPLRSSISVFGRI